ncbi:MAG: sigma-70 family RNA polymerase sigma factor, partial [Planctomycetes bacterium]|nr:sigma-70 family RNA polymerase sigma factor [Planctomycetota bacterium]
MPRAIDPEILLTHGDFVRRLARQLITDESLADDVAQETWIAAMGKRPRSASSVREWLSAIARNAARMIQRGEGRRRLREEIGARPERLPSTADVVEREALRREVVDAVLGLDEPYRTTLLLRFFEDEPA